MEASEKTTLARPKVVHGPHRLRLSGVAAQPTLVKDVIAPSEAAADLEMASEAVDIAVETVPQEDAQ